jgi:monoamine oxidase
MRKSETEVVIIGGGAAGIAAANRLHAAGVDCLLVEARDRLGGRGFSVAVSGGATIDLGCGWLHSADLNPWSGIAKAQGRTIDKSPPPWAKASLDIGFPLDEQRSFIDALHSFYDRMEIIARQEPDVPASDALTPGGKWNALIGSIGTFISGGELERVSARDFDNYADTDVNWRILEGYGTTIAAHGDGVPLALDCPVQRIDHSGKRVRIETNRGTIAADKVVITIPTSVMAKMDGLFAPALPEKIEAAYNLPLGLDDKLFIALEGAEEFEPDSRLFGRTDRATAAYQLRPFGRPMIEAYFGGHLAASLEAGGPEAFYDFAVSELTGVLGSAFAARLKPIAMHPWGTDPYARGAYSFARVGKAACRQILAAPVDNRLFFAGEACSEHDFSTAHGAYRTGIAAADQVLAARQSSIVARP